MESLFPVVVFLAIATVGAALARRLGLLAPIVLVVLGLALSFVPGFPQVELDPELVLVGILPPLLYVAALETSVPAFKNNIRPILLLAVGLVLFTAFVVGLVLHLLLPQLPFAICLALGAVVAPPDAVAATAVARRVGLPAGSSPSWRARAWSTTPPRWCCCGSRRWPPSARPSAPPRSPSRCCGPPAAAS
ncbi:cation:proton antiporter [Micromonospora sp. M12]